MSRIYDIIKVYVLIIAALVIAIATTAQETRQLAVNKPQAIADLKTREGAAGILKKVGRIIILCLLIIF